MKKSKPAKLTDSGTDSGNELSISQQSDKTPSEMRPTEYYEIKMAWSEYRNGKWIQKQLSTDALISEPRDEIHDIQYFKFVPIVYEGEKVLIDVDGNIDIDWNDSSSNIIKFDGGYIGSFKFDGNSLQKAGEEATDNMPIVYFNQFVQDAEGQVVSSLIDISKRRMYSWQILKPSSACQYPDIYFSKEDTSEEFQGPDLSQSVFYHPYTKKMLGEINKTELDDFFKFNLSLMGADDFGHQDGNATETDIYHELKRPYSLYNWELFLHTPTLIADALSKSQHFEEAMKWYHFVFNPIADGLLDTRFWQFQPFKSINSQRILDSIFNKLEPNAENRDITEWRNNPFMPHLVARSRPVAYMKWVVMKYIDNLLAWGDYLFRQDTIESINQATQLYVLSGHILGPRPLMIPKRGKIKPQT
jgi:hypothetical protein